MLHKALDSRSVNAKKLKRLEVLSRAVVVAEAATRHVKLISPAVAALKFLVETLRDARRHVEDAFVLTERLSNLLQAVISRTRGRISKGMENYIKEFCITAEDIKVSLVEVTTNGGGFFRGIFGNDTEILRNCNASLDAAMELLKLQSDLEMHVQTAAMRERMEILHRRLTNSRNSSPATIREARQRYPPQDRHDTQPEGYPQFSWQSSDHHAAHRRYPEEGIAVQKADIRRRISQLGHELDRIQSPGSVIDSLAALAARYPRKNQHSTSRRSLRHSNLYNPLQQAETCDMPLRSREGTISRKNSSSTHSVSGRRDYARNSLRRYDNELEGDGYGVVYSPLRRSPNRRLSEQDVRSSVRFYPHSGGNNTLSPMSDGDSPHMNTPQGAILN